MKKHYSHLFQFIIACTLPGVAAAITTVPVGDIGNVAHPVSGHGAVSYGYSIGAYEITNAQYTEFLNAVGASDPNGLYKADGSFPMNHAVVGGIERQGFVDGSYSYNVRVHSTLGALGSKPVTSISVQDAMRYANWLSNGKPIGAQGVGTTETGAYDLTGTEPFTRGSWFDPVTGNTSSSTYYALMSVDEFAKAAYYSPLLNGGVGGYYEYGTQSDTGPTPVAVGSADPNTANYAGIMNSPEPFRFSDAGAYVNSGSYYGIFDATGNAAEYTDSLFGVSTTNYHFVGGAYSTAAGNALLLSSDLAQNRLGADEQFWLGFRVVEFAPVPEPSTTAAILGCIILISTFIQRKRKR